MTRRSLLTAAAGAVAGGFARPRGALGAFAKRLPRGALARPIVFERAIGALPAGGAGRGVDLGANADLVGLIWSGPASARVELRFRQGPGRWSRWVSAGSHRHAAEGATRSGTSIGEPIWTGGSSAIQVRSRQTLGRVRVSCVDVSDGAGARTAALAAGPSALAAALPLASPTLAAGPGQPPIVARRAWAQGACPPKVAPEYGAVALGFVHHTENPNGYTQGEVPAMLRAIYAFHRFVRGWDDIGYNFVIDLYGRIFEARAGGIDEPVAGAQAGGYNLVSTGVAVLGEFMSVPISAAAASALERLLAWKLSLHGIPVQGRVAVRVDPAGASFSRFPANARVSLPRVAGHRDADSTDCPGNVLYGELPSLRARAHALAGRPAQATLALGPAPVPTASPTQPSPPAPPSPGAPVGPGSTPGQPEAGPAAPPSTGEAAPPSTGAAKALSGRLTFLDGAPIAGTPLAIQARSVSARGEVVHETTIAQTQTDAEGRWSLPVTVARNRRGSSLRVLCTGLRAGRSPGVPAGRSPGVPAVVSDPLRVAGGVTAAPVA